MISLEWVLGIVLGLVGGSYTFTWLVHMNGIRGRRDLWKEINSIKENEIKHIEERLAVLEEHTNE